MILPPLSFNQEHNFWRARELEERKRRLEEERIEFMNEKERELDAREEWMRDAYSPPPSAPTSLASGFVFLLANPEFYSQLASAYPHP
jgi:hypothetical protein